MGQSKVFQVRISNSSSMFCSSENVTVQGMVIQTLLVKIVVSVVIGWLQLSHGCVLAFLAEELRREVPLSQSVMEVSVDNIFPPASPSR